MSCLHPFFIERENKITHELEKVQVPCGHCEGCLKLKQSYWISRLMLENLDSKSSYFVTLTYSDQFLPIFQGVKKSDVQKFIKRLRKIMPVRYFCVSEYGSKFSRPHYHLCLFFKEKIGIIELSHLLEKTWKLGKHCIGYLDIASVSYCAKYCLKDRKDPSHFYPNKTFSLMSKKPAIGASFFFDFQDEYSENEIFQLSVLGNVYAMPRYFRDKIFTEAQKYDHFLAMQEKYNSLSKNEKNSESDLYDLYKLYENRKNQPGKL